MDEIKRLKEQKKDAEGQLAALIEQKARLDQYNVDSPPLPPPLDAFERLDQCPTRKQHRMKVYLQHLGVLGLWHAVYTNAKQAEHEEIQNPLNNGRADKSWRTLIDDYEEKGIKSRSLYYLMSIPEEVLMAIIEGNLPSRMQEDSFRSKYTSFLSLKPNQGVYVCYVGVAHQDIYSQLLPLTASLSEVGYGLTLGELGQVIGTMHTYCINDSRTGNDRPVEARDIDTRYRPSGKKGLPDLVEYQDGFRRYSAGIRESQFDRIINYLYAIDDIYDIQNNATDMSMNNKRLQRCFCYVGLSHKVKDRAPEHHTHTGKESQIWGLFTAICRYLFHDKFSNSDFTYQVIQTVRVEDIGLDEILVSVLASGYGFDGGLSAVHAGQSTGSGVVRNDIYHEELNASARLYRQRGQQAKNISNTLTRFEEAQKVIEYKQDDTRQELENRLQDLRLKCDQAIKHYRDLIAHLDRQIIRKNIAVLDA